MKKVDKERKDFVHLYLALRRKKENPDLQAICFRQIINNESMDLKILKTRLDAEEGIWRIHKTVNKRDCRKAANILIHKLIDNPESALFLPSLWKSCLLQPESKGERNFLLDIDSRSQTLLAKITHRLEDLGMKFDSLGLIMTPNGYHVCSSAFDPRIFNDIDEVEIKKDGYIFVELYKKRGENVGC